MLPHVLNASAAGGSIDATTRSRLEEFLTHLEAASAVITTQRFTPQELPRQLHIVATGHAFITQVSAGVVAAALVLVPFNNT